MNNNVEIKLIKSGLICGLIASLIFPLWSLIKFPYQLNLILHFAFGPLLVVSFYGIQTFLTKKHDSASLRIGSMFGIIAGVAFCCMTVVQASNLNWINDQITEASDQFVKEDLKRNLQSVFSVQLGLDIVWDIFITASTLLIGISILNISKYSMYYGIFGIIIGLSTLVLNFYTFPVPPRDFGIIDLGPYVGLWFLGLITYLIYLLKFNTLKTYKNAKSRIYN